jgi:hypothetical protein
VCERRVNLLVYSLSLHRHSYIGFILAFASSIHNKQQQPSDGAPEPDALRAVVRKKILRYRQLSINRPDPVAFMTVGVDTSVHIYDYFSVSVLFRI